MFTEDVYGNDWKYMDRLGLAQGVKGRIVADGIWMD